jgi:hypothetical protein
LAQSPEEQNFFIDKITEYYLKYALQKNILPKNDEAYEFSDKSIFTLAFDDVRKIISISYQSTNPVFDTGSKK